MKRLIVFEDAAFEDFKFWVKQDKKIALKIIDLIDVSRKTPFEGIGKPEPLKFNHKGYWSRRITDEHRLLYKITEAEIIIVSARFHY